MFEKKHTIGDKHPSLSILALKDRNLLVDGYSYYGSGIWDCSEWKKGLPRKENKELIQTTNDDRETTDNLRKSTRDQTVNIRFPWI